MVTLTIFSDNEQFALYWQTEFPNTDIAHIQHLPAPDGVWIVDCTTLSDERIEQLIAFRPTCCYAVIDEVMMTRFGIALLDADISLITLPLSGRTRRTIERALQTYGLDERFDATETDPLTYSDLAQEFAIHANDLPRFTERIAATVCEIMQADWVCFLSVSFDQNENYSVEVLGMVGDVPDESAENVIRPHGMTMHIMMTQLPVVMSDARSYRLDGLAVNPITIEAGFYAGLGLPLLIRENETFGVMWVMYREPHHFSYADVRHMQVYASHIALAYGYHIQKKLVAQWQIASQRIFTRADDKQSLEQTLQYITAGIHDSLDCDVVTLYRYNDELGILEPPYDEGAHYPDAIRIGAQVKRDSIVYEMLSLPEPLILENAAADDAFRRTQFLEREDIQSVVIMPLYHANETIGIVFLNYRQQRHFTEDERSAIALFADQIAVSMHTALLDAQQRRANELNTELIEQIREQGEQLQTLVKVIDIERNLSQQDREAILLTIATQTKKVAGADRVTIRLVQDEHVQALAVYPPKSDHLDDTASENWSIRLGGHSQHIVQTNQPVIIPDVDNYDPALYDGIQINPRWRGVWKARIGLPLTSGEKAIGVMWLSFRQPRPVTPSQLSAFQSFANIAFLTKMYDIEQERVRNALLVMSASHETINTTTDIDTILRQTMKLAADIVSSRDVNDIFYSHVAVVTPQHVKFLPEHNDPDTYRLLQEKMSPDASIALDCDEPCLVAHAARENQTILVKDASTDARFLPLLHDHHAGSQLSVPIVVGGRVFAVVSIEHTQPKRIEWYDRSTIQWLASFVGQVIHNQQQQQIRQALFEASQAITESKDLQTVLETIAQEAHRVLAIKRGAADHDAYVGLRHDNDLVFYASYPPETLENIRENDLQRIDLTQEPIGVSGLALQSNQVQIVSDVEYDTRAFQLDDPTSPRSLMAIPIPNLTDDQPAAGVLSLGHRHTNIFDDDDVTVMVLFAKFAAVSIRRAREQEEQRIQGQSLLELTRAAMDQVIASHDLNNFRMVYRFEFPQLREYVMTLVEQEDAILKSVNDSHTFDALEEAIEALPEALTNLQESFDARIDHETHIPELGERAAFPLREWLWQYHKEKHVHLQIDDVLNDNHQSIIPKYWLREVIKILLTNAERSIKFGGYVTAQNVGNQRLIQMTVAYQSDTNRVSIRISNPGNSIPKQMRPLLTHRVIPPEMRQEGERGRGIGLFMSGIIMRAYEGDIYYSDAEDETIFVLEVPIT